MRVVDCFCPWWQVMKYARGKGKSGSKAFLISRSPVYPRLFYHEMPNALHTPGREVEELDLKPMLRQACIVCTHRRKKEENVCWLWWHLPFIPAWGRQSQLSVWARRQPGLRSACQAVQDTRRNLSIFFFFWWLFFSERKWDSYAILPTDPSLKASYLSTC